MKRRMGLKLLVIGLVTGVILLALTLVNNVISDRQQYREEAVKSIEDSYAGPQTMVGPVLVRPYTQTTVSTEDGPKGTRKQVTHVEQLRATSFPQTLEVRGKLVPSERRHGLYKVTVYEFAGQMQGVLDAGAVKTEGTVAWGEPYLALAVADVRGIVGTPRVVVNGAPERMMQGADSGSDWKANLRVPLHGAGEIHGPINFSIDMNLNGTEQFSVAPVGDSNHVELSSTWHSPLFAGQFLPRTREVGPAGFTAAWDVSSLATGTQMQMGNAGAQLDMMNVSLLTTVDPYKLSDRATKYGVLFVVLTFGGFLLFEVMKELPIHPMQYLLVGFGLAIFFLLLVSFSEHLAFGQAYLLASAACIGLLAFYLSYVLRSVTRGVSFGAMLSALYAAMYGLLISEDNSLVLGSVMLFAVLAGVMVVTRKMDWYRGAAVPAAAAPPPPVISG